MMNWLTRILRPDYRPDLAFQAGHSHHVQAAVTAGVFAAESLYGAVGACLSTGIKVVDIAADGSTSPNTQGSLAKALRRPNAVQSPAAFWSAALTRLVAHGELLVVCTRDDRGGVASLMLPSSAVPVAGTVGPAFDVTLPLALDPSATIRRVQPSDYARVCLNPDRELNGRGALAACAAGSSLAGHAVASWLAYNVNSAKPGTTLGTDKDLTETAVKQLRASMDARSGSGAGGTVVLHSGLKYLNPMTSPADSAAQAAILAGLEEIARAFGVPSALLGAVHVGSNNDSVELIAQWKATSIAGLMALCTQGLAGLMALDPDQIVCDLDRLDSGSFLSRLEALQHGGIPVLTSNEARQRLGLAPVAGGADLLAQSQLVPATRLASGGTTVV